MGVTATIQPQIDELNQFIQVAKQELNYLSASENRSI